MKIPSMRNLFRVGLASVALMIAGVAVSQQVLPQVQAMNAGDLFQDIPNGLAQSTAYFANSLQVRSYVLGQSSQHLAAPTLTTTTSVCGGNVTSAINGTDTSGQITMGNSASTNCTVTFATNYASPPECFVSIANTTDASLKCNTTNSTLVITETSATNNLINYLVVGLKGG